MQVLLVEPDRVLGETLSAALKAAGHTVTCRRSAQTALDVLDDPDAMPDAVILEIQLGLHNGIEFLYEIRSYPEWQHMPVIVHTMNPRALDEQFTTAFAELGVPAVLYKPRTSTHQLLNALAHTVLKP